MRRTLILFGIFSLSLVLLVASSCGRHRAIVKTGPIVVPGGTSQPGDPTPPPAPLTELSFNNFASLGDLNFRLVASEDVSRVPAGISCEIFGWRESTGDRILPGSYSVAWEVFLKVPGGWKLIGQPGDSFNPNSGNHWILFETSQAGEYGFRAIVSIPPSQKGVMTISRTLGLGDP